MKTILMKFLRVKHFCLSQCYVLSHKLFLVSLVLVSCFGLFSSEVLADNNTADNSASTSPAATQQSPLASALPLSVSDEDEDPEMSVDEQEIREEAFSSMSNSLMPLTPSQIHRLRSLYNSVQRASADTAGPPPKPAAVSRMVDLSPGATPPIVRLSSGFITSVVFLDSTGAPWPIQAYDVGDPRSFNIQWDKKGNTLLIQAITAYKRANLAVMMRGLNTPIMITLIPGQRAVDYRVDMQVPRLGPNAEVGNIQGLPGIADPRLLDVLNGIPPKSSKTLEVMGGHAEAWLVKEKLFLRTPLTVISPGWVAKMSSSDGVLHAYLLPKASVVLALQNGRMIRLIMKGL